MAAQKYRIVNADGFGQNSGINRGIIAAHENGIVTSASLMVRWRDADEAAQYSREHPSLSLGLHFDLGENAYRNGAWVPLYQVVPVDDITAVADELSRQLAIFHALVGRDPTHIDSHQHAHTREPARSVAVELARKLAVPLRHCSPEVRYCKDFYGQMPEGSPLPNAITVEALIKILAALPPGITELGCHPGEADDLETMYRVERAEEVKVLCLPQVRAAIVAMDIELCSFSNAARLAAGTGGSSGGEVAGVHGGQRWV
jgi:chitin disaccharide deacetylase